MSAPAIDGDLATARRAVRLRQKDPREAATLAQTVLDGSGPSERAVVVALLAKSLAVRELGELDMAESLHRSSIELSDAAGFADEAARARSYLVGFLTDTGEPEQALQMAELALRDLPTTDRPDLQIRQAVALERLGRISEAVAAYSQAIEVIDLSGDPVRRARARTNRGVALVYNDDIGHAVIDLTTAERLADEAGHHLIAGAASHNLAFAYGRGGDIVSALDAFERAKRRYDEVDHPPRLVGLFEADRCAVLLAAGLLGPARRSAELGVALLSEAGEVVDLAEARLLLARACLAGGDFEAAADQGAAAADDFDNAGRSAWAAIARYVTLRAQAELGDDGWLDEADAVIEALVSHGWGAEADDVRIFTAQQALRHGDSPRARLALRAAAGARRTGRADRRAQAWLAAALLREADGDRRGARSALRSGLKVLDEHRSWLGATELRVGASNHATALASMGVGLALDGKRAADVLVWADRLRASALDRPPTRPPDDRALAADLARLRSATSDLTAVRLAGDDDREPRREVMRLEASVRDRARRASAKGVFVDVPFGIGPLREALDGAVFIEYLEHDGQLHAITVDRRRSRLHGIGPLDGLDRELDAAHFAMRRLAGGTRNEAARAAAGEALGAQLNALSDRLLSPILADGDAPVVIVPTGALHRVPWGALAQMRGRAVTVSPSGSLWLAGASRPQRTQRRSTVFVAGPDLSGGNNEVRRLRRANQDSAVLTGRNATVARTLDALGSARIAHIAAHGVFRADSPMFSSLRLHDGPLTLYDLEGLRSVPETVVLPACDAGVADISLGDEVTGTAAALLGLGATTVIAPIAPISDEAATPIVMRLHRALADSHDPAAALVEATTPTWNGDDPAAHSAAAALTCFGTR